MRLSKVRNYENSTKIPLGKKESQKTWKKVQHGNKAVTYMANEIDERKRFLARNELKFSATLEKCGFEQKSSFTANCN